MAISRVVRAAWPLLAVMLLSGLIAMHGLADWPLSAAPSHVGGSGAVMGAHMATNTAEPAGFIPAGAPALAGAAQGCGMDHAGCVAVLPANHLLALPGATTVAVAPTKVCLTRWRVRSATGSRGPPEVSLAGLGISRT